MTAGWTYWIDDPRTCRLTCDSSRPRRHRTPRVDLLHRRARCRRRRSAGGLRNLGSPRIEPHRVVQRAHIAATTQAICEYRSGAVDRRSAVPRARHPRALGAGMGDGTRGARSERRHRARRRRRPVHPDAGHLPCHPAPQRRPHDRCRAGRWNRRHAVAQPSEGRRLQVQPAPRRTGRHRRHRLDRDPRQRTPRSREPRRPPRVACPGARRRHHRPLRLLRDICR